MSQKLLATALLVCLTFAATVRARLLVFAGVLQSGPGKAHHVFL
jgi:hypothetical protein